MHYAKGLCLNCYHSLYKLTKPDIIKRAEERSKNKKKEKVSIIEKLDI